MKILISVDIEGIAGVAAWEHGRQGAGAEYEIGRRLMLGEVNAACRGAFAAGAAEIIVNDSHGRMSNLDPAALEIPAMYLSGAHKPDYMMQGISDDVDAVFFLGYHGSVGGAPAILSHTYNPEVFTAARVNDEEVGEGGINMLMAPRVRGAGGSRDWRPAVHGPGAAVSSRSSSCHNEGVGDTICRTEFASG